MTMKRLKAVLGGILCHFLSMVGTQDIVKMGVSVTSKDI